MDPLEKTRHRTARDCSRSDAPRVTPACTQHATNLAGRRSRALRNVGTHPGHNARLRLPAKRLLTMSFLDQISVLLANLARLGQRVMLNVRFVGMLPSVILVVLFGRVICRERFESRHDRSRKKPGLRELLYFLFGGLPLCGSREEDGRTVLRSHVVPLAIELRRIVCVEEHVEQLMIGDLLRVVGDADHFCVPRISVADAAITGRFGSTSRIPAFDVEHSFERLERRLGAPETAAGKYGSRSGWIRQ